ncbi:GspH/FimT family pseudopilin [Acinetobacter sp. ANC 3813]|uniref:GspH/FimT family pseudopilin n=1 Tax=Acinetobacter sp. ANC 3813 TaxID=1977873 RepID=UPI000A3502AF|nr:GspH/FimT family pseudopilin [Acinetobacter sp. ANC 3813]OTG89685.1 prepilin-type cleavage/methylation domain-containing protein [Acinetobacter sp. ANC 3813]
MRRGNGFTLIELMVTIAVLAIVVTLAAPSFSNLLIKENLKTTAFNMRDTLKEARSRALLNRASTVVCTSLSKSASAVTQDGCGANLTNYVTTMSTSLKNDSVFIVNVEKKISVKGTSSDSFVFSPRGNLTAAQTITFCSSTGSYILTVGIPGTVEITQGGVCS